MITRRDVGWAIGLWALAFSVYFLTYSGYPISDDERAMFVSASSFQKIGRFTIHPLYYLGVKPGSANVGMYTVAGEMVPNYEPGQILAMIPLLWLSDGLGTGRFQTAMLVGPVVAAAAASVLYLITRGMGFSVATATLTVLFFAFGTLSWPYSQRLFREPLTGFWLLLAFGAPFLIARPLEAAFFLSGLAFGGAVATKQSALIALPGLLLAVGPLLRSVPRDRALRALGVAIVGFLAVMLPAHLYYRTTLAGIPAFARNVMEYSRAPELAISEPEAMIRRAMALTLSPGKGLLTYSPALLLALFGLRGLFRLHPFLAGGLLVFGVLHVAGYSRPIIWWGGLNWGPRYMVPLIPAAMLAAAPAVEQLRRWPRGRGLPVLIGLGGISILPQLAGVLVDPRLFEGELDRLLYQRLRDYPQAMERVAWDWTYNPILGHWRMLLAADPAPAWIRSASGFPLIWPPVAVGVGIGAGALAGLWRLRQGSRPLSGRALVLGGALGCGALLAAAVSLHAVADDPRYDFHENARFLRPMIEDLNREARPGDALLMTYPYFGDYFLNWLRAPVDWYAIFSTPTPLPQPQRALIDRVLARHPRVWLMRPWNRWHESEPGIERYLILQAYKIKERDYESWMRLMLYLSPRGRWHVVGEHIRWANGMELAQAAVQGETTPVHSGGRPTLSMPRGAPLRVAMIWQATHPSPRPRKVFVHIGRPDQPPLLQQDRLPADGWEPVQEWRPGKQIMDLYGFMLDLPPGRYLLRVGLYDEKTGQRELSDHGEVVDLLELEIR
ncbi:hypothetical protein [Thermoflexus sp.]|uniref:ArnT family glycosyltransferase n=1 Tax=Thermoflexus sp. TaxID=1969742 RepID=UPI002ADDC795|nr:hypothetical protein [Thermoflexus sp.]